VAIARIAALAGQQDVAKDFVAKAKQIKELVQTKLWDKDAQFFKVLPRGDATRLVDVRELHGYTPWYFNLPDKGKGYELAWKQLMDPKGFFAPFGPTTAVTPRWNSILVLGAKDLKPKSSRDWRYMAGEG
jgi:hypothetical protein